MKINIPKNWREYRLDDLTTDISDGSHFTPRYIKNGIPFLSVKNVREDKFDLADVKYISKEEHQKLIKRCKPEKDDILYTKVGTTGIAKVIDIDLDFSIFVSVALLKLDKMLIYPFYLSKFLNSPYGRLQAFEKTKGTANKNLVIRDIKEIKILLPFANNKPNLSEQKRIADKIEKLFIETDKAIEQTKIALGNSKNLLKSELKKIFENNVSNNWKVAKLKEVCEFYNGKGHEKNIKNDGKYVVVNSKFISLNGAKVKRSDKAFFPLMKNDLVMVMSDVPNGKALAKCFVIDKDDVYTLNQRICVLRSDKFEVKFLYYQLNRNKFYLSFDNGQKQTNLRKDDILECPLFVPEISVQENIVKRLDKIKEQSEELTQKYQEQLNNFNKLKQSILNQAFQGKL